MSKNVTTSVKYGLRVKKTGKLAQLYLKDHSDADMCMDIGAELVNCGSQDFILDNHNDVLRVLMMDTEWYNSSPEHPSWGDFNQDDLEVVSVLQTIEPVDVPLPAVVDGENLLFAADCKASDFASVTHVFLGSEHRNTTEVTALFMSGDNYDELENLVGKHFYVSGDPYLKRTLYAVVDVPEHFKKCKADFVLVCSHGVY